MDGNEIVKSEVRRITDGKPVVNPIRQVGGGVTEKPEKGAVTKAIELIARRDARTLHDDIRRGTVPKIYGFIRDILHTVIDSTFNGYGGGYYSSSSTRYYNGSTYGNPSYLNSYYGNRNTQDNQPSNYINRTPRFTSEDVVMRDWASAEDLLNALRENIRTYGSVSIAELFDAMYPNDDGPFDIEYNDHYYGWTNLDNVGMRSVNGGWVQIMLPKPIQIR